jgi:predicted Zn-dependent protease
MALMMPLAACSTNPATGQQQFAALMSPAQEANVGATEHQKIMQSMGDRNVPQEVKAMVAEIGAKLAANTERPDVQYKFFVLDSPDVNAFALPGGYVYVTRGLLALANSETELAGVLAHEIGHITGRHSAERYSHGVLTSLGAAVLAAAIDSPAASQALGVGSDLYLKSYSRGQEHEADGLGVRYLQRAGFDPYGMASFLENLQRNEQLEGALAGKKGSMPGYLSTHPQTADRVAQARAQAQQAAAEMPGVTGKAFRANYINAMDGLMYGDSPDHGFVRGNAFYHPEMNFMFTVPDGFKIINQPEQVVATGPGGAVMIFDAAANPQQLEPAAYITRAWLKKPELPVQAMDVNGKAGATAAFDGTVGGKAATVRVIAVEWMPGHLFRFQIAIPQGADTRLIEELKKSSYSLRQLSAEERKLARPYVLRSVVASGGDTVASLARRMPFKDMPEERFRVLNGMNPGQMVQAGETYKVISDR